MSRPLEFFFDYGSPFSYLADTQLEALCAGVAAELVYRPMLLGGVFKATGNRSPAEDPIEARRRYGGTDLRRWVAYYGVPFRGNPHFPVNTLRLMRCAVAAQRNGVFPRFHAAAYPAFWVEGRDLGSEEAIASWLGEAGLDAASLIETSQRPEVKDELRANTEEAVARGAFGAPTFFVGDEMFWGNDRLVLVRKALEDAPG